MTGGPSGKRRRLAISRALVAAAPGGAVAAVVVMGGAPAPAAPAAPRVATVRVARTNLVTTALIGIGGCASRMAQEFGDHPDAAATRMRWVGQLIAQRPAAQRQEAAA